MSWSTQTPKFLLDENVRIELLQLLQTKEIDAIRARSGAPDTELAKQSLEERRILVTNDEDFSWYAESEIFWVIWLRIPQHDAKSLCDSFEKLAEECTRFTGKLILLKPDVWEDMSLGVDIELTEKK